MVDKSKKRSNPKKLKKAGKGTMDRTKGGLYKASSGSTSYKKPSSSKSGLLRRY